jgi:hypothetical protein
VIVKVRRRSLRPPFDAIELVELTKRLAAVSAHPAVAARKQHEPAPAVALGLDPAAERNGYGGHRDALRFEGVASSGKIVAIIFGATLNFFLA